MDTFSEPSWFGPYRLTSRLATGGMAEIYVGRHVAPDGTFGPLVAVKRLLPHLMKDMQVVRMFLNEARITSQINHPNVVRIVDLGQHGTEPFIAMELLEGRTFAEVREQAAADGRRLPIPVALRIMTEACRGLHAAHHAVDDQGQPLKLVHRDFTPDNIHVGFKGEVKVIDFGVAKTNTWASGTEPGTLKGKFFYMSPEMILSQPIDHRADVFAAGVMLYEQLTGHRPFTGTSVEEVVTAIAAGRPKLPRAYDPAVPPALEDVTLKALAHDPAKRFQTLAELADALEAIGGAASLASHEHVGEYLGRLFPLSSDPRRQTLRRAREVDPSLPHAMLPEPHPTPIKLEQLFAATAPPQPLPPESPTLSQGRPQALQRESPTKNDRIPKERRPLPIPLMIGAALALTILGGAGYWLTRPGTPPAERLEKARALKADRATLLAPLVTDKTATPAQLAEATALLLEAKVGEPALELAAAWQLATPTDPKAFVAEAEAATLARKGKRAQTALDKARTLAPNDATIDVAEAKLKEAQGDPAGAAEAWGQAAKKRPKDATLVARQGFWLSHLGRLDEAEQVLNKALAAKFEPATAAELAGVRVRKGNLEEASALLRRALKESPDLPDAHYYLGAVLFRRGDISQARAEYLKADALAPSDSRALVALCQVEAHAKAPTLAATKQQLQSRFPEQSKALLAQCDEP